MPEGHSMRTVSAFVASPKTKRAPEGWTQRPPPLFISRSCQNAFPPIVAWTRTLAPIAERLDAIPTNFTSSQALELPLLWYRRLEMAAAGEGQTGAKKSGKTK